MIERAAMLMGTTVSSFMLQNAFEAARRIVSNGHDKYATPDYETRHARFPHPIPPPEGEGEHESLREFHVKMDALLLTQRDFEAFTAAIENPPKPNSALRELMARN